MRALLVTCQSPEAGGSKINAATILKFKGSGAITTTTNRSLLDIAKLLAQHRIGCIVKTNSAALYRSTIAYGRSAKAARRSLTNRYPSSWQRP